jgi:secreted PhoX family phosphatase
MANLKNTGDDPDPELTEVHNLMSRRETLAGAAKLVAGLSIGAQVMAATGADTALAQHVRDVAGRADKPGYGPLTNHTGEMSLPEGFHYVHFGDAYTPMSDGFLTPPCHDGTTVFRAGQGVVRMIRNHEGYGKGKTRGGQVQRLRPGRPRRRHQLALRHRQGRTAGERHRPQRHARKLQRRRDAVGLLALLRGEHRRADPGVRETARVRVRGVVYLTEDSGDPADGFYRFLPDDTPRLHKGGTLQMLAVKGRGKYDTTHGQKGGEKLDCEWVTIDDPDPPEAETEPAAVWRQGRAKGAAQFMGVEGYESTSEKHLDEPDTITVSPRGGVLVCEDGNGEDEAGGDNYLRILSPAGKLESFARNDTPLDLHRWEEDKPGVIGRSEYSGSCYSPDGQWLFVHLQYPGRTFAITGPWEKGWL